MSNLTTIQALTIKSFEKFLTEYHGKMEFDSDMSRMFRVILKTYHADYYFHSTFMCSISYNDYNVEEAVKNHNIKMDELKEKYNIETLQKYLSGELNAL